MQQLFLFLQDTSTTSPQIPLLDKLIAIGIILLILSLINELIVKLIRKWLPYVRSLIIWVGLIIKRTKSDFQQSNNKEEKSQIKRRRLPLILDLAHSNGTFAERHTSTEEAAILWQEVGIMTLSAITGCFVAFFTNVDLIALFRAENPVLIMAENQSELSYGGVVLTGLFLSLGSKFFHDLLDTLLQIKNLKRKLNKERTYEIESIREFDEYLKLTEGDMVRRALQEHRRRLLDMDNVWSVESGLIVKQGQRSKCVVIKLSDGNSREIGDHLPIQMPSGTDFKVPVKIERNLSMPAIHFIPGDKISPSRSGFFGTYGCLIQWRTRPDKRYLLTCSHVVNEGKSQIQNGFVDPKKIYGILSNGGAETVGKLVAQWQTEEFDIALIEPTLKDLHNIIDNNKYLTSARAVLEKDLDLRLSVSLRGAVSGKQTGSLRGIRSETKFKYEDEVVELSNLICVSGYNRGWHSITERGDSGSIIYDNSFQAIGMIVGGNQEYSYAIPLYEILRFLDAEIVKS